MRRPAARAFGLGIQASTEEETPAYSHSREYSKCTCRVKLETTAGVSDFLSLNWRLFHSLFFSVQTGRRNFFGGKMPSNEATGMVENPFAYWLHVAERTPSLWWRNNTSGGIGPSRSWSISKKCIVLKKTSACASVSHCMVALQQSSHSTIFKRISEADASSDGNCALTCNPSRAFAKVKVQPRIESTHQSQSVQGLHLFIQFEFAPCTDDRNGLQSYRITNKTFSSSLFWLGNKSKEVGCANI